MYFQVALQTYSATFMGISKYWTAASGFRRSSEDYVASKIRSNDGNARMKRKKLPNWANRWEILGK